VLSTLCIFCLALGHVLACYYIYKVKCRMVALHFYGCFSIARQMIPDVKGSGAIIAAAGPLFSFILAAIFAAPYVHYRDTPEGFWGVGIFFYYACYYNIVLAVFNLLPIYPMSGGRIVKSLALLCFTEKQAVYATVGASVLCLAGVLIFAVITKDLWLICLIPILGVSIWYEVKRVRAQKNQQHQQLEEDGASSPKQSTELQQQPTQKQQQQTSPNQQQQQPTTSKQQEQPPQPTLDSSGDVLVDVSFESPKKPEKKGDFWIFLVISTTFCIIMNNHPFN